MTALRSPPQKRPRAIVSDDSGDAAVGVVTGRVAAKAARAEPAAVSLPRRSSKPGVLVVTPPVAVASPIIDKVSAYFAVCYCDGDYIRS